MDDFAARLDAALGRPLADTERLAIAVSGGPDSVALLLMAAAALPGRVVAVTVDHGLRAESADEAREVSSRCAAGGIPHATLVWVGTKPATGVPAAARDARYALMAAWCAEQGVHVLATGHHADDQAETLLMRLARGSGGGLAGIRRRRPVGHGVTLVRPVLDVRRDILAGIASASGWAIAEDSSNHDMRYARTRARNLLTATDWIDVAGLAAAAAHTAELENAIEWTTDAAWAGRARHGPGSVELDATGLPAELVRRLVLRAIADIDPAAVPRGPDITRLITRLERGEMATLAGVKARGGRYWRFSPAPPRR